VEAVTVEAATSSAEQTGERESRSVQTVVETHSEHLVLALGVMIYRKKIPSDAVSIIKLFRDTVSGRVSARRIRFTDDGRFKDPWPDGFFAERQTLEDGTLP
jgi:predicted ATPase